VAREFRRCQGEGGAPTSDAEAAVARKIRRRGGCSRGEEAPAASDVQEAAMAREFRRCQGEQWGILHEILGGENMQNDKYYFGMPTNTATIIYKMHF
jgi:hypothetical protein